MQHVPQIRYFEVLDGLQRPIRQERNAKGCVGRAHEWVARGGGLAQENQVPSGQGFRVRREGHRLASNMENKVLLLLLRLSSQAAVDSGPDSTLR